LARSAIAPVISHLKKISRKNKNDKQFRDGALMKAKHNAGGLRPSGNRWLQLVIGVIAMGLIANVQYSWTLFVRPIHNATGWSLSAIQVAFTIFIITETWLGALEGWFVDRYGPRPVAAFGAILIFVSWNLNAHATTLIELYAAAAAGGTGVGCVYSTCVGNALKWFPDKRGLASGLVSTGFGVGAAITVIPIANAIRASGYQYTFALFAMILGGATFALSMFLKAPSKAHRLTIPLASGSHTLRDFTLFEALKTGPFWMMYLIFTAVAGGGLIATAQIAPIAHNFGLASTPVAFLGTTLPLLTLTMSIDNLASGLTRPLTGFISDRIGRENLMLIVFIGEGIALLGLVTFGHNPIAFLIFAPAIFLFWGEIYAISSALAGDTFGSKHVTATSGALFSSKGIAALCVPLGSLVAAVSGSWTVVFVICAAVSIAAALLSKLVLAPLRAKFIERSNATMSDVASGRAVSVDAAEPITIPARPNFQQ
jgi:OFA family oxalate/formate antiporter-like MFS transporter